jgi:hypothetical protein
MSIRTENGLNVDRPLDSAAVGSLRPWASLAGNMGVGSVQGRRGSDWARGRFREDGRVFMPGTGHPLSAFLLQGSCRVCAGLVQGL